MDALVLAGIDGRRSSATQNVDASRDGFKVCRVHAAAMDAVLRASRTGGVAVVAQVIKVEACREGSDQCLVHGAMGMNISNPPAVAVGQVPEPWPTLVHRGAFKRLQ